MPFTAGLKASRRSPRGWGDGERGRRRFGGGGGGLGESSPPRPRRLLPNSSIAPAQWRRATVTAASGSGGSGNLLSSLQVIRDLYYIFGKTCFIMTMLRAVRRLTINSARAKSWAAWPSPFAQASVRSSAAILPLRPSSASAQRRDAGAGVASSAWARPLTGGAAPAGSTDFPYPISLAKAGDNPRDFYERMVKEGKIRHDDRQLAALRELEKVWLKLEELGPDVGGGGGGGGGGFLSSWFGKGGGGGREGPTGLYMYGGVGTNSPKSKAPSWLPIA